MASQWKPYSQRQGRGPRAQPLSHDRLVRMLVDMWNALDESGYFQEAFGVSCVDSRRPDGIEPGSEGSSPVAVIDRELDREIAWPYSRNPSDWETDALLDVAELLFQYVSKPWNGPHSHYHSFSDCGWHYGDFLKTDGQTEYRNRINKILPRLDPPLEMADDGYIVNRADPEYTPLVTAGYPRGTEQAEIIEHVEHAKRTFRDRHASMLDQRQAVVNLAGVVEYLQKDASLKLHTADEKALFQIANRFALRHNERAQKGDYDTAIWYRWMFYVYLATIHAALRVRER